MRMSLNRQGLGLLLGLGIQYLLGMAINLFVEFPVSSDPHTSWDFTLHSPLVLAHLIIGTLIVLSAIALMIRVIKQKASIWQWPAISGLLWVLVAWIAGDTFVTARADILSYLMSLAFLFAAISYVVGVYRSRSST